MHKENTWLHTATRRETGVNKTPGSPRAWLNRALDQSGPEISTGRIRARDITVAGVWIMPKDLPDLPYDALYRFFEYLNPDQRPRATHSQRAIGVAWTVPSDKIFTTLNQLAQADLVWWAWPTEKPETKPTGPVTRLSHPELYQLFQQGQTAMEISLATGMQSNSVRYVYKKWQAGLPALNDHGRRTLNHAEICDDLRTYSMTLQQVADKHGCSRNTIHKINKAHNIRG